MDSATAIKAMEARHSVRSYTDAPLSEHERATLQEEINRCNAEGGLHIQLVCDEPEAFDSLLAHYGKFSSVRNYLMMAGPASDTLDERCGYYGERIVLLAQKMGLNTCWVALTFKKRHVRKLLRVGDKLALVIAIGHGTDEGKPRKSKSVAEVSHVPDEVAAPDWFERGVRAALLAPTAINQQSFSITLTEDATDDGRPLVEIISNGGSYANIDLGIARLHFELGAGTENFAWA